MITKASEIAIVMNSSDEAALFSGALGTLDFKKVTSFLNSREAYESAVRKQFDLFILRIEMPRLSGPTFIQKIRETGNYGMESHLLVGNTLDPSFVNLFVEYEIKYVLIKPFNFDRITEKMAYLVDKENHLSPIETQIREVRSAFVGGQLEMAKSLASELEPDAASRERVLIIQGDIEFKEGNFQVALSRFREALSTNGKSVAAAHRIANTLMSLGELLTSYEMLSKLREANQHNLQLLTTAGLSSMRVGKLDEAEEVLMQVKSLDEENKEAGSALIQVFIHGKKYLALQAALDSSNKPEDLLDTFNSEGKRLFGEGKKTEAIEIFKLCLDKLDSRTNTYGVHFNLAQILLHEGQLENARFHLVKALEYNPTMAEATRLLEKMETKRKRQATK
jgi:tetratricopeptide (TPR) repeat protein